MSTRMVNDLLNLAYVVHWHTVPTRRKASVAEHSFRVAVITMELCHRLDLTDNRDWGPVACLRLLEWALRHDGPESETGDLPHTTKRLMPDGVWSEIEKKLCPWYPDYYSYPLVKVADLMECYMFICEEGVNREGHNAEIGTRNQLYDAIDAANMNGLDKAVWDIISESRLPSDTRHNQNNGTQCQAATTAPAPANIDNA